MAAAFIQGMQGEDPLYLKTAATAKHFAAHSGPEALRHGFDAQVTSQDLMDSYLPQFELAVKEGKVESVMCAYNAVNGVPACANSMLLESTLRRDWGFQGYVVSDCWAISDIYAGHQFAANPQEASALALRAGTDLACGPEYAELGAALEQGLVAEAEIDRALTRLLRVRLRLFNGANPYRDIPYSVVDSPRHRELALEAARKSIVLLKNENQTLPLPKSTRSLAVIGPNADSIEALLGNYNGYPTSPITPLAALRDRVQTVYYAKGSDLADGMPALEQFPFPLDGRYYASHDFSGDDTPVLERAGEIVNFEWWQGCPGELDRGHFGITWTGSFIAPETGTYYLGAEAQNSFDLFLDGERIAGTYHLTERGLDYRAVQFEEGRSYAIRLDFRSFKNDASIRLLWSKPGSKDLDDAVDAATNADAAILFHGLSPRLENEDLDRTDLELPAMQQQLLERVVETGKPVVLVLLSGSALAVNWAKEHVPAIVQAWYPGQAGGTAIADVLFGDYNPSGRLPVTFYRSAADLPALEDYSMANRTYRFFNGEVLYPFGHGLSYTTFQESPPAAGKDGVTITVTNTGNRAGEHTVQLYANAPDRALTAFGKVAVAPGESKSVTLAPYHRTNQ